MGLKGYLTGKPFIKAGERLAYPVYFYDFCTLQ
jgi:hypothetical protein